MQHSANEPATRRSPLVFLNLEEVKRRCGNKSTTWVYEQLKSDFPRQVRYGNGRSVAWIESEVQAWLEKQIEASRA